MPHHQPRHDFPVPSSRPVSRSTPYDPQIQALLLQPPQSPERLVPPPSPRAVRPQISRFGLGRRRFHLVIREGEADIRLRAQISGQGDGGSSERQGESVSVLDLNLPHRRSQFHRWLLTDEEGMRTSSGFSADVSPVRSNTRSKDPLADEGGGVKTSACRSLTPRLTCLYSSFESGALSSVRNGLSRYLRYVQLALST